MIAKCFACRNEQNVDSEHVAGKALMKDFEQMYKQHPDWLIRNKNANKDDAGAAAEANEDQISEAKRKKLENMISSNKEIDPLDATKLDLNSPEICKYSTQFLEIS